MKLSLSHIFEEVKQTPNFQKVRVGLFNESSDFSRSYGDEYDDLPGGSSSSESDIEYINITPVMSVRNPKFKEALKDVFSEDKLYDMGLDWGNDESGTNSIICTEGVLMYKWYYDEDYSGGSSGSSLDIDTLDDDKWQKIKDAIKPILEQSDINDAIKDTGEIKRNLKNQYKKRSDKAKTQDRLIKKKRQGDTYEPRLGPDNYLKVITNDAGKKGIKYTESGKIFVPIIFDDIYRAYGENDFKIVLISIDGTTAFKKIITFEGYKPKITGKVKIDLLNRANQLIYYAIEDSNWKMDDKELINNFKNSDQDTQLKIIKDGLNPHREYKKWAGTTTKLGIELLGRKLYEHVYDIIIEMMKNKTYKL
tara:strand:- start:224 stop:1315 length:1092 start_codon:yes stop_codon:yes gene_type:complete